MFYSGLQAARPVEDTNMVDAKAAITSSGSNIVFNKKSSFVRWKITMDRFVGYNGIPDSAVVQSFNEITLDVDAKTTHYVYWSLNNQHYKQYVSDKDLFVNLMSNTAAFYNRKSPLTVLVDKID